MSEPQDKPFNIPKRLVWEAYEKVKANKGAAGVDRQSIEDFESGLKSGRWRPRAQRNPGKPARVIGRSCAGPGQRHPRAALTQERWPAGARRAPRALEDVKKVITTSDNIRCRRSLIRWPMRDAGHHPGFGNTCLRVPADALHRALAGNQVRPRDPGG